MTSYADALRKGLAAHRQSERARHQMEEVLSAASKEIGELLQTDVALRFETHERYKRVPPTAEAPVGVSASREVFTGLIARSPHGFEVLADIKFGELGYPVTLRWEGDFRQADDRAAFESVLAELLESRQTGGKLQQLVLGAAAK